MIFRTSDYMRITGLALLYALLAKPIISFISANGIISIVWPLSGLAIAALLIGGRKYWPAIYIGDLAGNIFAGSPIGISFAVAAGNTLEAIACVLLIARIGDFDFNLTRTSDFFKLGIAGMVSASIAALIGVSALMLANLITRQEFAYNLLLWWQGDVLGIILGAPLILVWRQLPRGWLKSERVVETIACFGLAFLAANIICLGLFKEYVGGLMRSYWMFLFVVWAAVRFGRHGALLVISFTSLFAVIGATYKTGIFSGDFGNGGLINSWLYISALTITGLSLALIIEERRRLANSLSQSHDLLNKLSHHLPGVIYQFKLCSDGRFCFPFASEAIQDIFDVTPEQVKEDATAVFAELHPEEYDDIVASIHESAKTLTKWQREFRVMLPNQETRWMLGESSPERLEDGGVLWHGFIYEITERKLTEEKILRLKNLYKALSEVNQAIVRMHDEAELFPLVCRCAVEFGGMSMAWVGEQDKADGLVMPAASYGSNLDYLDGIVVSTNPDMQEGLGPIGISMRENKSIIVNDYFASPLTIPWQAKAADNGWKSAAAFPISRGGRAFAALAVYHSKINAFDEDAIALLEEMATDIAFALDNFDREAERKLNEESLQLAASIYATSSEAMMVADSRNRIIAVNPAFTEITGYTEDEVIGKDLEILKSKIHDEAFYQTMWKEIDATGSWQGEIWGQRKNGENYPKWLNINTVYDKKGAVLRRIALFNDNSQIKEFNELIWRQANFDLLTGLPNRHMFHNRLEQEIKKAHRTDLPLTLLFLDLDYFKEVNDTLGHAKGDLLLKEAARRLTTCIRESDTVARFGGDEFTILLSELHNSDSVNRVIQDVLQVISEPFQLGDELAYVSVSIGITCYPDDGREIDVLLKNADQAMYAAKSAGRNGFSYFTPMLQAEAGLRMRMANDLRGAVADKQLWVAYQPIVDLQSGKIIKAEALVRWRHPKHGLVSPAEFIPVAEHTGLINEIGEFVFHEAARQLKHWQEIYDNDFQISINVSPIQFNDKSGNYKPWYRQLKSLGLKGKSIVVEITEGLLLEANTSVKEKLLEFRDAGIQVALDDFGTGYSSLSYLKKFDIDYIKIDQSFTRNLSPKSGDLALCEAMVVMAHKLGLKVIAEGVETVEQYDLLAAMGCDLAQGYIFSRPVPGDEFEKLLLKSEQSI